MAEGPQMSSAEVVKVMVPVEMMTGLRAYCLMYPEHYSFSQDWEHDQSLWNSLAITGLVQKERLDFSLNCQHVWTSAAD